MALVFKLLFIAGVLYLWWLADRSRRARRKPRLVTMHDGTTAVLVTYRDEFGMRVVREIPVSAYTSEVAQARAEPPRPSAYTRPGFRTGHLPRPRGDTKVNPNGPDTCVHPIRRRRHR